MLKKTYILYFLISASSVFIITGCAEIQPFEAPGEVLRHPLGTDPVRLGMTKNEVEALWGPPDQINTMGTADQWGLPKEEWIYKARYSKIPIDKGYLYKTKYLYFEGEILTSFGDEPKYRIEESVTEENPNVQPVPQ